MKLVALICPLMLAMLFSGACFGQLSANDTIRLGAIVENGQSYPMAFLPEFTHTGLYVKPEDRLRRDRLRRDIYTVYPYAITAATILSEVRTTLDTLDSRRERRRYLKDVDRRLDVAFKQPLKNLTIDQGHVLVKLINRQTGRNCYSIIREMKGGISAVVWQSVGLVFDNNLRREYDPTGDDAEMEGMVQVLEGSANYRYQLYRQQELMKMAQKPVVSSR
jgi:hypothetical protein